MPKFIIERDIPNAAALTPAELREISQRSIAALRRLGTSIQWVQSYVTSDKITCVSLAPDAELVREHARLGGFPCDAVETVAAVIDPAAEDGALWTATPAATIA